ncbi:MAG TPA: hypothetical protein P5323_00850 [Candidatus Moranbacteria bacterium]|nr:hypothetical protein [Candidatus Moranbacteria bacterium]HRY27663.1 hypothetical protein [Candidatus Moranbacteria bacterium]HSA08014.1 hypothetical protein [Candidatus Moranbacteria bacterium]
MSEKMFEPKLGDSFNKVPEGQKDRFKPAENGGFVYAEALPKEEAEIEAEKMQEKVEKELLPEVIEKIMKKVQDINQYGTAFTSIFRNKEKSNLKIIQSILKDGLLGSTQKNVQNLSEEVNKKNWTNNLKNGKGGRVFFNIVGRMKHEDTRKEIPQMLENFYCRSDNNENIYLIFDLKNFKEDSILEGKINDHGSWEQTQKNHTYKVDYSPNHIRMSAYKKIFGELKPGTNEFRKKALSLKELDDEEVKHVVNSIINEKGETSPRDEWGFTLSYRVAPRLFKGIVISQKETAAEISNIEEKIYNNKEKLLLPIYNVYGDLLWPKQMSYEEVKKFVMERDKDKKKEE